MAIREYIGARYVPKFYDDGQGGAEWTPDVQYEPLTVVLHEGNSYTSRQYVPVGIDIENTTYWLETGNWNSQVEAYRQEVLAFDDRITTNKNDIAQEIADRQAADAQETAARKAGDAELKTYLSKIDNVVVIGDSWTDGWNGSTGITPWQTYMKQNLGINNMYVKSEGGAGFGAGGQNTGKKFDQLLSDLIGTMSADQKNSIRFVIGAGGVNDRGQTTATIEAGLAAFCQKAKAAFPNAKIFIAGISVINRSETWGSTNVLRSYSKAGKWGAAYITNIQYATYLGSFDEPGRHLLDYSPIGDFMSAGIVSGSVDVNTLSVAKVTNLDDSPVSHGGSFNIFQSNSSILCSIGPTRFVPPTTLELSWNGAVQIGKWDIDSGSKTIMREYGIDLTVSAMVNSNNQWISGSGVVRFRQNGQITFRFAGDSPQTPNVSQIVILGGWGSTMALVV